MASLKMGSFEFSPKLIPTLATIVLVPFLASLGLWQLDRADQKRDIDSGVMQAQAKEALNLNTYITLIYKSDINENDFSTEFYRSASLSGHYDSDHQYLLDNRTHKGQAGFHVLTPFLLDSTNKSVLVNRGWITYQGTRSNIPDISITKDTINIKGVMKKQGRAIVLNSSNTKNNGSSQSKEYYPKLIQSIQLSELAKDLVKESAKKSTTGNAKLLPIIIELDKTDSTGFVREWQPYYGSIDKHNAYALQWFSFAGILLFLYIKLNTKKIKL
ncbi:MAG: SURF1 family protein [Cocleimonas sp.]